MTITTYCRMCGEQCCIDVTLDNGRIADIRGNKKHPWNGGAVCIKARAAMDWVHAPDRIITPLKRTGRGWVEIPLETALDEIASKMVEIKQTHGAAAVGFWKGEAIGFAQQEDYVRRFCHAFGSPNYFSCDSACFCGHYIGYSLVEGCCPVPDFDNSRCIVLWGTNPPLSRPVIARKIDAARRRGAILVVVDPRLTEAARLADCHVQLRPGTDGAFALGVINLMIENNWYDHAFVTEFTHGFDGLARYAASFSPERVEKETGVSSDLLRKVAGCFAEHAPQVVNCTGLGLEHQRNGVDTIRAVASIGALCGCIDHPGGDYIPEGPGIRRLTLYDEIPLDHPEPLGAANYPVLYAYRRECHTMSAMDTFLTGEPYPLKGLIVTAANPVLSNPNSTKVRQALGNLELLVVRDLFMTESSRQAHYFLPAASFLERTELVVHAMDQHIGLRRKVMSMPGCQSDYQFWKALADRSGIGACFPWQDESEVNAWLLETAAVSHEKLREAPEGLSYTAKRYHKYRGKGFDTASGKVEFASAYLKCLGFAELPEYHPPLYLQQKDEAYPFVLVSGSRKMEYCNSRYRNLPGFRKRLPHPEVEIPRSDAEKLGIRDGDRARVSSSAGSIELRARLFDAPAILPGTIHIAHGWDEANVNLLTPDDLNDPIDGFPLLKAVPVKVEKA